MPSSLAFPSTRAGDDASARHCLVFLITGNPGLVDYYHPFLSALRSLLDRTEEQGGRVAFHISARDLRGFDDADHAPFTAQNPPFDLEAQIEAMLDHVSSARIATAGPRHGTAFDDVVLIGHSVGAYIALELFHCRRERAPHLDSLNLRAAILLFPTIAHMARSPKGRHLERMRTTPLLRNYVPRLARALLSLCPAWALGWVVRSVMGFPPHAAAATMRFLASRDGVWQALYLGMDEMRVIAEERWAEELWEADAAAARDVDGAVTSERHGAAKFFFFFGKNDPWVADEHRDQFIRARAEHARREGPAHKRGRTRVVVDEGRLPHDFCIHHSEVVAERVKLWIDEIAEHAYPSAKT